MRFVFTSEPNEFARQAGPFIEPRLECNVMATVVGNVLDGVYDGAESVFAVGLSARDQVTFAALRTPPWFMLASELDPADAPKLVAHWLELDPELPGVNGTPATARAIAAAWRSQTQAETRCRMSQAMHSLTEVIEPARPASGELRRPEASELDLLVAWMEEFAREAGLQGVDQARSMVTTRLAKGWMMLWDDGGPVSLVGLAGPVAGVARIGPVYTPPNLRGHGYATSAVAAISRLALAGDAHTCMLYTDVANPTSNKIYAEIGYRRFGDWEEHAFDRAPQIPRSPAGP